MNRIHYLWVGISALVLFPVLSCHAEEVSAVSRAAGTVKSDFGRLYADPGNLIRLGIGIAGAGILANTSIDEDLRDRYQADLRSGTTDHVSKVFKPLGAVYVAGPLYLVAYGAGTTLGSPAMEEWAQKSIRASVVGAPAVLGLMAALGAERPSEGGSSAWRPFHSWHGVSAHAFLGGVPFLTAARMSENAYAKASLYGMSTLTALSRINDDEHYLSQAALGWFIAYLSTGAVDERGDPREGRIHFAASPIPGGWVVTARKTF